MDALWTALRAGDAGALRAALCAFLAERGRGVDDAKVDEAVRALLAAVPLVEGVFDPHVLKAVFLAGSTGAGKSFIGQQMFGGTGLKLVNSDEEFERALRRAGIDLKDIMTPAAQALRPRAKEITGKKLDAYLLGRLGLIIDGTAKSPPKILTQKRRLEELGYDTSMVVVTTSLEVAQRRNQQRARTVAPEIVEQSWREVQEASRVYRQEFRPRFIEIQNNEDVPPDRIVADLQPQLARAALHLLRQRLENPLGRAWMQQELAAFKSKPPRAGTALETVVLKREALGPCAYDKDGLRLLTRVEWQSLPRDYRGRRADGTPTALVLDPQRGGTKLEGVRVVPDEAARARLTARVVQPKREAEEPGLAEALSRVHFRALARALAGLEVPPAVRRMVATRTAEVLTQFAPGFNANMFVQYAIRKPDDVPDESAEEARGLVVEQFTKKHFLALATLVADLEEVLPLTQRKKVADAFADTFSEFNPLFRRELFQRLAKVPVTHAAPEPGAAPTETKGVPNKPNLEEAGTLQFLPGDLFLDVPGHRPLRVKEANGDLVRFEDYRDPNAPGAAEDMRLQQARARVVQRTLIRTGQVFEGQRPHLVKVLFETAAEPRKLHGWYDVLPPDRRPRSAKITAAGAQRYEAVVRWDYLPGACRAIQERFYGAVQGLETIVVGSRTADATAPQAPPRLESLPDGHVFLGFRAATPAETVRRFGEGLGLAPVFRDKAGCRGYLIPTRRAFQLEAWASTWGGGILESEGPYVQEQDGVPPPEAPPAVPATPAPPEGGTPPDAATVWSSFEAATAKDAMVAKLIMDKYRVATVEQIQALSDVDRTMLRNELDAVQKAAPAAAPAEAKAAPKGPIQAVREAVAAQQTCLQVEGITLDAPTMSLVVALAEHRGLKPAERQKLERLNAPALRKAVWALWEEDAVQVAVPGYESIHQALCAYARRSRLQERSWTLPDLAAASAAPDFRKALGERATRFLKAYLEWATASGSPAARPRCAAYGLSPYQTYRLLAAVEERLRTEGEVRPGQVLRSKRRVQAERLDTGAKTELPRRSWWVAEAKGGSVTLSPTRTPSGVLYRVSLEGFAGDFEVRDPPARKEAAAPPAAPKVEAPAAPAPAAVPDEYKALQALQQKLAGSAAPAAKTEAVGPTADPNANAAADAAMAELKALQMMQAAAAPAPPAGS
jgi:adenylate kinase